MPDWQELVKQRLKGIRLSDEDAAEVAKELADHLESVYQTCISDGFTEHAAVPRALREVSNWQELRTQIESSRKEETTVNKRVSQFWFPAFLTLFLSQVALMLIQTMGPTVYNSLAASRPRMMPPNVVYAAWLITLPLIGAVGAYLSRRAGGHAKSLFWAVAFPVFPFLAFLTIGLPLAMALDDHVARNVSLPLFLVGFSGWVVFPAVALIGGGLAVQYLSRGSDARRTASV